jgi:hypothetical protein
MFQVGSQGWPQMVILPISASPVAEIIGMSQHIGFDLLFKRSFISRSPPHLPFQISEIIEMRCQSQVDSCGKGAENCSLISTDLHPRKTPNQGQRLCKSEPSEWSFTLQWWPSKPVSSSFKSELRYSLLFTVRHCAQLIASF